MTSLETTTSSTRLLEDTQYETFPFGTADNEVCSFSWGAYYDNGLADWSFQCLYNVPVFMQDDGDGVSFRHTTSCWGQGTDFDNFACKLGRQTYNDETYGKFWYDFQFQVNCTEQDGCTCMEATIKEAPCDVCQTCSSFSTNDVKQWSFQPDMPTALELSCPADNVYNLSQQCSRPALHLATSGRDLVWFGSGIVVGTAMAALCGVYWMRQQRQQRSGLIDSTSTADYVHHDGVVA